MTQQEQQTRLKASLYNLGFEQEKVDSLFRNFHFPLDNESSSISIDNWKMLHDLQNGEIKELQMSINDKAKNYTVAASPETKSVNIYNEKGTLVNIRAIIAAKNVTKKRTAAKKTKHSTKRK